METLKAALSDGNGNGSGNGSGSVKRDPVRIAAAVSDLADVIESQGESEAEAILSASGIGAAERGELSRRAHYALAARASGRNLQGAMRQGMTADRVTREKLCDVLQPPSGAAENPPLPPESVSAPEEAQP